MPRKSAAFRRLQDGIELAIIIRAHQIMIRRATVTYR
jgi:hypothetical protein